MSISVTEKIANKVKYMPRDKQEQVLAYVEHLLPKPKSIEEIIADIKENIHEDELAKLPTDGALNHDYYLYGANKK